MCSPCYPPACLHHCASRGFAAAVRPNNSHSCPGEIRIQKDLGRRRFVVRSFIEIFPYVPLVSQWTYTSSLCSCVEQVKTFYATQHSLEWSASDIIKMHNMRPNALS
jgi:hypothetical protein